MKTNVCLIAPTPPPIGGIANWVEIITTYQQNDVDFFLIDSKNKVNPAQRRTIIDRTLVSGIKLLKIKKKLKHTLKKNKIDCVHITTSGSLGLIRDLQVAKICKKRGIRFILHLHFGRVPETIKNNTREWKLLKKVIALASDIITMDSKTYASLKTLYKNVTYIPNPINAIPLPKPNNSKVVLYVGWIVKTKGIEELISAWKNISKKFPDWRLELVGPYSEKYLKTLNWQDDKSISFLGEMSHNLVMEKMHNCTIFVLPSYTEGFPNVILEAMINAKPIIATTVGAIPEMLSENSGVLIEKESVKELENALLALIQNEVKCEQLGNNAFKRVSNNYTTNVVFEQLKHIWQKSGD